MGKIADTVKILLDIDRVLTSDDIAGLASMARHESDNQPGTDKQST
jgi:hypothetical protein